MTRARRGWFSAVMIAMALAAPWGCGGSSEDDDGGDGSGSGVYCNRAIQKFNGCGLGALLNDGDGEPSCNEPDSTEERCTADCLLGASCEALRAAICEPDAASSLLVCILACEPPPFTCGSGETVPESYECDFAPDCADGSDEHAGCSNMFTCNDGEIIDEYWECDGFPDCADGSDEHAGCPPIPMVTCADGEIVSGERCDGYEDCFDGSDEPDNCPPTPREEICGPE